MHKVLGLFLLVVGAGVSAFAAVTPEIDATSAGSAITLLTGAVLIIRGRRK